MNIFKLNSVARPIKIAVAAAALFGIFASCVPARADDSSLGLNEREDHSNGEIHIGGFVNQSTRLQDSFNTPCLYGGASWTIDNQPMFSRSSLSIDYIDRHANGNEERILPVQLQYQVYQAANSNVLPYFNVGAGLAFCKIVDNNFGVNITDQMLFSGFAGLGIDTVSGIFTELRYQYITETQGERLSGPELLLGIRF